MAISSLDPKEIRKLWILKLMAKSGTVKKAAIEAKMTSSAISQSLSSLEESLGRRLLTRTGDGFILTAYGAEVLNAAEPAFRSLENLHSFLNHSPSPLPQFKHLHLATTPSLAIDILPELTERMKSLFPKIRISLRVGRSATLCSLVRKGEIPFALVAENDQMEDLDQTFIASERMGFFCSSQSEIAKHGWDLVEKLGVAGFPPDADGYACYFKRLFKIFPKDWKPDLISESYEALRALAVHGTLVSVLSTRVAAVDRGDLIEILPPAHLASSIHGNYQILLVSDRSHEDSQTNLLAEQLSKILGD